MKSKEMMIVSTAVPPNSVLTRSNIPYRIVKQLQETRQSAAYIGGILVVSYNLPNEPFSLTFHETRGQLFHTVPQLWTLDTVIYTMLEENESDVVGVEGACDMSQPRNNPQLRT